MKHTTLLLLLFLSAKLFAQEPVESDFFSDGIDSVSRTVNLVTDYNANGTDEADDSEALQKAIDELTQLPNGGKIIIPKGVFYLMGILFKDNIHIEIDAKTVLKAATQTGTMFSMGLSRKGKDAAVTIKNVSIRGNGGSYTVDFSNALVDEKLTFVNCRNVHNFMVADFEVFDYFSKMSCVTLNSAYYDNGDKENLENWEYWEATNGVVKNGMSYDTHIGYGLVQMQVGKNIFFKNLDSENGGITLRMESGASADTPDYINVDNVWARKISCHNGGSTFAMGSHVKANGYANLKNMSAYGCARVGGVGLGFTSPSDSAKGIFVGDTLNVEACMANQHDCLIRGRYNPTSQIDSVHAKYGTSGIVKSKHFQIIPCEVRHLLSSTPREDENGYKSPSYGVMTVEDSLIYKNITNVTFEGFPYKIEEPVFLGDRPKISNAECEAMLSVEKVETRSGIFPNPSQGVINVSNYPNASFQLLDLSGKILAVYEKNQNRVLDICQFKPGVYLLNIHEDGCSLTKTIMLK